MKRTVLLCITLVTILFQTMSSFGQNDILTTIVKKTTIFPSTGLSYWDDPSRYFTIMLTNISSESQDIYIDLSIACDFSNTGNSFRFSISPNIAPVEPLTLAAGQSVTLNRTQIERLFGNQSRDNITYEGITWQDVLMLPEGQYQICVTPYKWQAAGAVMSPVRAGDPGCCMFNICYSGNAPEFVTPVVGQSAGNLNMADPRTGIQSTSDNRGDNGYTSLTPTRNLIFRWTGVVSNCLPSYYFEYVLKIVELFPRQNAQDAIKNNPTIGTVNNGSRTTYTHDTLRNLNFQLVQGRTYVAQVSAVLKSAYSGQTVNLGNDGNSQIIVFTWGESFNPNTQGDSIHTPTRSYVYTDNSEEVLKTIREHYIVEPGLDSATVKLLTKKIEDEASNVPTCSTACDRSSGYPVYQVPKFEVFEPTWMPVRGDSVIGVSYAMSIYKYIGGDIVNSMSYRPVKQIQYHLTNPLLFEVSNTTPYHPVEEELYKCLEEGEQYVLTVDAAVTFKYAQTTTITITEYVDNVAVMNEEKIVSPKVGVSTCNSNIIFAWGLDSATLKNVTPAEITYPDNITLNDSTWSNIIEVEKRSDFSIKWKKAEGISVKDTALYDLYLYVLKKGQTLAKATAGNPIYKKTDITDLKCETEAMRDSLTTNRQYVVYIKTHVKKNAFKYNIPNEGKSKYLTFKMIEEKDYNAALDNKRQCHPEALANLSKTVISPKVQKLIDDKKRIMLGDFPLVMQTASLDSNKKTYSGNGYVVWKPLGVEIWVKVQFDTIQINDKYQAISGTAKGLQNDESNYVVLGFDADWTEWTDDNILDNVAELCADNEKVKNIYDEVNNYSSIVQGARGIFSDDPLSVGVVTLPLSLDESVTHCKQVKTAIGEMFFSPTTSLMNVQAVFGSNEDNLYVPFVATNVCMAQNGFVAEAENGLDLYLAKNMEFDLKSGYKLRLKRADTLGKPKNGTFVQIFKEDSTWITLDAEMDLGKDQLIKADLKKNGTLIENEPVQIKFGVQFRDWSDWIASVSMDPFSVRGIEGYTFIPTGKGIYYDHSKSRTPKTVKFPEGYDSGKNNSWQGFYMEQFTVLLPDDISNTFTDGEAYPDSMVIYSFGVNGTVKDSTHFYYNGSRISIGAEHLILDSEGISITFAVKDILKASTNKAGGWAFDVDTVALEIVKSQFKNGRLVGSLGMPLFTGRLAYGCVLGKDDFKFNVYPKDTNFKLDLWLANVKLDAASSHFSIEKRKDVKKTLIDLTLNGTINIDFDRLGVPVEFAGVKFEDMYLRNYTTKEVSDPNAGSEGDKGKGGDKKKGKEKKKKLDYEFNGLAFDAGTWSKASPQKRLGVTYVDDVVESTNETQEKEAKFKGSIGGFSYNVYTLDPIFELVGSSNYKCGLAISGDMSIGIGAGRSISGGAGFAFWGEVNTNSFDVKNWGGRLDSISIGTKLDMFSIEGKLHFFSNDSVYGDGIGGSLKCSIMEDKVKFAVGAGFGTVSTGEDNNKEEWDWWYLEGVANCKPGIPIGAINLTGLGGGFAYNMEPKDNCLNKDPRELRKANSKTNFTNQIVSSGMAFKPSKGSWVAKAGVAIALPAPNTMNAEGVLCLRMANEHFSGISLLVNASVITNYNKETEENSNVTLKMGAYIEYEEDSTRSRFVFSACAESNINLTSFLKDGAEVPNIPCKVDCPNSGKIAEFVNPEVTDARNAAGKEGGNKSETDSKNNKQVGASASVSVPIDLVVTHYKHGKGEKSGKETEWYFSIGRPDYDERVTFSMKADLIVCSARAKFTFYFLTGNYFPDGYTLPELPTKMVQFLGDKYDKAQKGRKMEIQNAGGFAMGASFEAEVSFDLFLYVDISACLGFDVALLDVNGQGCNDYQQIGKNDFYALGQVYAMLDGDMGLSLNLGFWKGKISLLSLGVGALLQGGGPNPTWAYGLLRMKCSCLGGLIKINTSVDFKLGDVCIPGAGDPLANVHLFENITPGFGDMKDAQKTENVLDPLILGVITSNMPWDEEVILCAQEKDDPTVKQYRKFIFKLDQAQCRYEVSEDLTSQNPRWHNPSYQMKYKRNSNETSAIIFECEDGGFEVSKLQRLTLTARAYEYRAKCKECDNDDQPVDIISFQSKGVSLNEGAFDWFNPRYDEGGGYIHSKPFQIDTTIYFTTHGLPDNLYNQVVYTWPYNGDPSIPVAEIGPTSYIYTFKYNDSFDNVKMNSEGTSLKAFVVEQDVAQTEMGQECNIIYSKGSNNGPSYMKVDFPSNFKAEKGKIYAIQLMMVNKEKYSNELNSAMQALQVQMFQQQELHQRDLLNLWASSQTYVTPPHWINSSSLKDNSHRLEVVNSQIQHDRVVRDIQGQAGLPGVGTFQFPGRDPGSVLGGRITVPSTSSGPGIAIPGGLSHPEITNPGNSQGTLVQVGGQTGIGNVGVNVPNIMGQNIKIQTPNVGSTLKQNPGGMGRLTTKSGQASTQNHVSNVSGTSATTNSALCNIPMGAAVNTRSGIASSGTLTRYSMSANSSQMTAQSQITPTASRETKPEIVGVSGGITSTGMVASNPTITVADPTISRGGVGRVSFGATTLGTFNYGQTQATEQTPKSFELGAIQGAEGVAAYNEFGADTMMEYTRTLQIKYSAALRSGSVFYTLYFQTDPTYTTYKEIFTKMQDEGAEFKAGDNGTSYSNSNKCLITKLSPTSHGKTFERYAYLFGPYETQDKLMYRDNVKMPPIAVLMFDRGGTSITNNEGISRYAKFTDYFSYMHSTWRCTNIVTEYHKQKHNWKNDPEGFKCDESEFDDPSFGYHKEFNKDVIDESAKWAGVNYRELEGNKTTFDQDILGGSMILSSGYYMGKRTCGSLMNTCPNILIVVPPENYVPRIDSTYFQKDNNGRYKTAPSWKFYNASSKDKHAIINDYATPVIYDDIKMYYDFFNDCIGFATYYLTRGYNYKLDALKDLYKDQNVNHVLTFDNFPYKIRTAILATQFFNMFNQIQRLRCESNTPKYYRTPTSLDTLCDNILYSGSSSYQATFFSTAFLFFKGFPTSGETKGVGIDLDVFKNGSDKRKAVAHEWYTSTKATSDNIKEGARQTCYLRIGYMTGRIGDYGTKPDYQMSCIAENNRLGASSVTNNEVGARWCDVMNTTMKYTYPLQTHFVEILKATNSLKNSRDKLDNYSWYEDNELH